MKALCIVSPDEGPMPTWLPGADWRCVMTSHSKYKGDHFNSLQHNKSPLSSRHARDTERGLERKRVAGKRRVTQTFTNNEKFIWNSIIFWNN